MRARLSSIKNSEFSLVLSSVLDLIKEYIMTLILSTVGTNWNLTNEQEIAARTTQPMAWCQQAVVSRVPTLAR